MQFYIQEPEENGKLNAAWERAIFLFGFANLFVDLCQEEEFSRSKRAIAATETDVLPLQMHTT